MSNLFFGSVFSNFSIKSLAAQCKGRSGQIEKVKEGGTGERVKVGIEGGRGRD
jgi:hypothetical protein